MKEYIVYRSAVINSTNYDLECGEYTNKEEAEAYVQKENTASKAHGNDILYWINEVIVDG